MTTPVDWDQLGRFAERHQTAGVLGLATAALFGVERLLGELPAPDSELRQMILCAALRAADLRRRAGDRLVDQVDGGGGLRDEQGPP